MSDIATYERLVRRYRYAPMVWLRWQARNRRRPARGDARLRAHAAATALRERVGVR